MTATAREALTGEYDIDPAHTRLGFVARHAMVTKVRGAFTKFEGSIYVDGFDPARSHGWVRIDATSIDTGSAARDEHLRGNDFLDMEHYPEILFQSTSVEPGKGDQFTVKGDLTVKGATRPVTLDVEFTGVAVDPFGNTRVGFEATGVLFRKDWGITWNAPLETGGVLVSDKINLDIDVSAIRRP